MTLDQAMTGEDFPSTANGSSTITSTDPIRGRQRVSSSVSMVEDPHGSFLSPTRRRPGLNVMIPMGGLGSRFKSGTHLSFLSESKKHCS